MAKMKTTSNIVLIFAILVATASTGAVADGGGESATAGHHSSFPSDDDRFRLHKIMADDLKQVKKWLEDTTVQLYQISAAKSNMEYTCRHRIASLEEELSSAIASKNSGGSTSTKKSAEDDDHMTFHRMVVDDLKDFKKKLEDTSVELFQLAKSKSLMEKSYENKIAALEEELAFKSSSSSRMNVRQSDLIHLHKSIAEDLKLFKQQLEDTNAELDQLQKAKLEMELTYQSRIDSLEQGQQQQGPSSSTNHDHTHDDDDRLKLHKMMADDLKLLKKQLEDTSVELFQLSKSHSTIEQVYQHRMALLEEQERGANASAGATKHNDGDHMRLHTIVAGDLKLLRKQLEDTYVELHKLATESEDMKYGYESQIKTLKSNLEKQSTGDHRRLHEIMAGDMKLLRKQLEDTYVELHQLAIAKNDMEYEYESQLETLKKKLSESGNVAKHDDDDGRIALHKVVADDLRLYKKRLEDTSVDLFQMTKAKSMMEQEYQDRIATLQKELSSKQDKDQGDRIRLHKMLADDLKLYKKRLEDTSVELFQMMKAKSLMEQEYKARITKFSEGVEGQDRLDLHKVMSEDLKLVKKQLEDTTVQYYIVERAKVNMEESYEKRIATMAEEFKQEKKQLEESYQSRIDEIAEEKSSMSKLIEELKEDLQQTQAQSRELRQDLFAANERIRSLEHEAQQWYIVRMWNVVEPTFQTNIWHPVSQRLEPIKATKTFQHILSYREKVMDDMEYWIREASSAVSRSCQLPNKQQEAQRATSNTTGASWLYDGSQFVHRNSHSIVEWTERGLYVCILNLILAMFVHGIQGMFNKGSKKQGKTHKMKKHQGFVGKYDEDDDNTEQTSTEVTLEGDEPAKIASFTIPAAKKNDKSSSVVRRRKAKNATN